MNKRDNKDIIEILILILIFIIGNVVYWVNPVAVRVGSNIKWVGAICWVVALSAMLWSWASVILGYRYKWRNVIALALVGYVALFCLEPYSFYLDATLGFSRLLLILVAFKCYCWIARAWQKYKRNKERKQNP